MLEIDFVEPLKLMANYILYASTQNSEPFSIIAEGLDWTYPNPLPDTCCNFEQQEANTGLGLINAANPNLDGSGTIVPIYSALGPNGSIIKSITVTALQSTHQGMVRLFVTTGPNSHYLMFEVVIPFSNQSSFIPSYKTILPEAFHLQTGYSISASTQVSESFAITIEGEDWSYPI